MGFRREPSLRVACGAGSEFDGTITQVGPLRVDVAENEDAGLQVDSETRIEGFDRAGIATLEPGDEIAVRATFCADKLLGPVADVIRPG